MKNPTESIRTRKHRLEMIAMSIIFLAMASNLEASASSTTRKNGDNTMNLTKALEEAANKSSSMIPEEARTVMKDALDDLKSSMIEEKVIRPGDIVPDVELPGATGKSVNLKELLASGPVVLVFYRGGWCPFCNLNLHYLQKNLNEIKSAGANLIAISPELPDKSLTTKEKNNLEFEVLSDSGNKVAKKFGIVFQLPKNLQEIYKQFGIDLIATNGDSSFELPLAATFIIGQDGKILYRFVDTDYKKRMDPEEILKQLKNIPTKAAK